MDLKTVHNTLRTFFKENSLHEIIKKTEINEINVKENISLTVIFTTNDRQEQTYFTLKSWDHIAKINNINIQIIIVDDTPNNKLNIQDLKSTENLEITYIYIKNKNWLNPCLNYNIGFEFIKSDYVVISNAEVCVFGNIYEFIKNNLNDNNYLVFDVCQTGTDMYTNTNTNKQLYDKCSDFNFESVSNFLTVNTHNWLQGKSRNSCYHYLTVIHRNTLQKHGGFDLDFSLGTRLDDRIFINKLRLYDKIQIINFFHDTNKIIGFHQWHTRNYVSNDPYSTQLINIFLNNLKNSYISNGKYEYLYNKDIIDA